MIDWSDEPWVKLYRRDTADWLALSWQARGLFALLLRAVTRAGTLDLGKTGPRAVAVYLHAPWAEIEAPLAELVADGCVIVRGTTLCVRNYVAAQEATQSDRARQRLARERHRDLALGELSESTDLSRNVTSASQNVTRASRNVTETSRAVTRCHAASRREEKRGEETEEKSGAPLPPTAPQPEAPPEAQTPAASCTTVENLSVWPSAAEVLSALGQRASGDHELELHRVLKDVAARGKGVSLAAAKRLASHLAQHTRTVADGSRWKPTLHHLRGADGRWTPFLGLLEESEACTRCDEGNARKAPQRPSNGPSDLARLSALQPPTPAESQTHRATLAQLRQSITGIGAQPQPKVTKQ